MVSARCGTVSKMVPRSHVVDHRQALLGDRDDARDLRLLTDRGLTHAEEEACHFPDKSRYLHLRLKHPDEAFERLIPRACDFIDEGRTAGGVLVHCSAGVSRSPFIWPVFERILRVEWQNQGVWQSSRAGSLPEGNRP
jgi:predicted protein tyrosine phosphatase